MAWSICAREALESTCRSWHRASFAILDGIYNERFQSVEVYYVQRTKLTDTVFEV